jgi:hypothetical protein
MAQIEIVRVSNPPSRRCYGCHLDFDYLKTLRITFPVANRDNETRDADVQCCQSCAENIMRGEPVPDVVLSEWEL